MTALTTGIDVTHFFVYDGLVRVGWFFFSHFVWLSTGAGIPVPEAAASHWLTWALGAIAVAAAFGLIRLPKWCRNVWLGSLAVAVASATSVALPLIQKDTRTHELVIMKSWWFVVEWLPPMLNTLLIITPATVALAWLFFQFCEKPHMRKTAGGRGRRQDQEAPLEPRVLALKVSAESEI